MPMPEGSERVIIKWFENHNLEYNSGFFAATELYHDLIIEWSLKMNLVSKNDQGDLLDRHILDSLTPILEIPETGRLMDIGSGAGFPAIPIALVRPELEIVMIESRGKKAAFLNEAIARLGLSRVSVWNGRLEEYASQGLFDIVTARGVAISEKIMRHLRRHLERNGKIIYYNRFNDYKLL